MENENSTTQGDFNYQRIEKAIQYLETNFREQPNLDELAREMHVSPFHFQRIFTEWAGISPKRFLQFLTKEHLKDRLQHSKNLIDAAEVAGLSSQSRVYDLFVTLEAVTPQEFKEKGAGLLIEYGFQKTPFGECLIALTERGICGLYFVQDGEREPAMTALRENWENATLLENTEKTAAIASQVFGANNHGKKLHLLVKGTNFQVKVWEALLQIPQGEVRSYENIAKRIQQPKALQAVGSAIGANNIAYLIPCHRVIRKDGISGNYRWGAARKKSMLAYEMAHTERTALSRTG